MLLLIYYIQLTLILIFTPLVSISSGLKLSLKISTVLNVLTRHGSLFLLSVFKLMAMPVDVLEKKNWWNVIMIRVLSIGDSINCDWLWGKNDIVESSKNHWINCFISPVFSCLSQVTWHSTSPDVYVDMGVALQINQVQPPLSQNPWKKFPQKDDLFGCGLQMLRFRGWLYPNRLKKNENPPPSACQRWQLSASPNRLWLCRCSLGSKLDLLKIPGKIAKKTALNDGFIKWLKKKKTP